MYVCMYVSQIEDKKMYACICMYFMCMYVYVCYVRILYMYVCCQVKSVPPAGLAENAFIYSIDISMYLSDSIDVY